MRVELALFDGDTLLDRGEIVVTATEQTETLTLFRVSHKLRDGTADVVLDDFADRIELKRSTLLMPVHESSDWESVELGKYTLVFWCRTDG